jgi:centromere/kinetochore protein ZW10
LEDISTVLSFVSNAIFPAEGEVFVGRSTFLATLHQIVFGLVLERLILPNMPSDLDATQGWLETVAQAVQIERQHSQTIEAQGQAIIEPFFVEEAGKAWANAKRRVNAEAVRKLILGGWLGWESRQAEREKELVMVVEVEVEEEDLRNNQEPSGTRSHSGESRRKEVANGWGLDEEQSQKTDKSPDDGINDDSMDVEEGWGFEGEHEAGPSSPKRPSDTTGLSSTDELDEGEGWDFEDPVAAPSQPAIEPPAPIIASKPAREAKRLGKKVAKVKAQVDDDPWGSGSESLPPSHDTTDVEPSPVVPQISRVATPSNAQEAPRSPAPPSHSAPAVPRSKRKELREERRTIRETFLVSRACDQLLKSAESSLRESEDLKATS